VSRFGKFFSIGSYKLGLIYRFKYTLRVPSVVAFTIILEKSAKEVVELDPATADSVIMY
jgi:hypothetical protein